MTGEAVVFFESDRVIGEPWASQLNTDGRSVSDMSRHYGWHIYAGLSEGTLSILFDGPRTGTLTDFPGLSIKMWIG